MGLKNKMRNKTEKLERLTLVKGKFKLKRKVVNAIPLKMAVIGLNNLEYLGLAGNFLKKQLVKDDYLMEEIEDEESYINERINEDRENLIEKKPKEANAYLVEEEDPFVEEFSGFGGFAGGENHYYPVLYLKIKEGK